MRLLHMTVDVPSLIEVNQANVGESTVVDSRGGEILGISPGGVAFRARRTNPPPGLFSREVSGIAVGRFDNAYWDDNVGWRVAYTPVLKSTTPGGTGDVWTGASAQVASAMVSKPSGFFSADNETTEPMVPCTAGLMDSQGMWTTDLRLGSVFENNPDHWATSSMYQDHTGYRYGGGPQPVALSSGRQDMMPFLGGIPVPPFPWNPYGRLARAADTTVHLKLATSDHPSCTFIGGPAALVGHDEAKTNWTVDPDLPYFHQGEIHEIVHPSDAAYVKFISVENEPRIRWFRNTAEGLVVGESGHWTRDWGTVTLSMPAQSVPVSRVTASTGSSYYENDVYISAYSIVRGDDPSAFWKPRNGDNGGWIYAYPATPVIAQKMTVTWDGLPNDSIHICVNTSGQGWLGSDYLDGVDVPYLHEVTTRGNVEIIFPAGSVINEVRVYVTGQSRIYSLTMGSDEWEQTGKRRRPVWVPADDPTRPIYVIPGFHAKLVNSTGLTLLVPVPSRTGFTPFTKGTFFLHDKFLGVIDVRAPIWAPETPLHDTYWQYIENQVYRDPLYLHLSVFDGQTVPWLVTRGTAVTNQNGLDADIDVERSLEVWST